MKEDLLEQYIAEEKFKKKKRYCVMTQPYGSGVAILNNEPHDDTSRSIKPDHYEQIVNHLKEDCLILYGSKDNFKKNNDTTTVSFENTHPTLPYIRILMSLIAECDYFIGCDSVGQHIARAFGKKGLIIMGSTGDIPFSYPKDFIIYRKAIPKFFSMEISRTRCYVCS
jgi:ADP-heptose:LPS heptosyltransferase